LKRLLIIGIMLSLTLGLNGFCDVKAETTAATGPDEAVIAALLPKTYATTMLFKGSNDDWDCSYRVMDTVAASSAAESATRRMKFVLTPLLLDSKYYTYTRFFKYAIQTCRGKLSGELCLKTGQDLRLEGNTPFALASEQITVRVQEYFNNNEGSLALTNVIPAEAITPEQALRIAFEVYYATYGVYPTADFTFEIEFYGPKDWLVIFDDNDGIGGKGYLLIDALTGEPREIKEDE
jgi:hypothetical protein